MLSQLSTESIISGVPIRIPVLDIHPIGAGGGLSLTKIRVEFRSVRKGSKPVPLAMD
jgi:N-methylhydantoinase A/oxoprolinase/acetone carboxylase beta subunit